MQVVLLLLGTLVLSSSVLYVSADTEIYSDKLDLYNKKKVDTEDSNLEETGGKLYRDENKNAMALQNPVEEGRSSFLGLDLEQLLTSKCLIRGNTFNFALLNQLLTNNGLPALTDTSTLTTTIINQLLLANGQLEITALNQILQGLGITPLPVPGNTLDRTTIDRILAKLSPDGGNPDFTTLNECLDFIGLAQTDATGTLNRRRVRRLLDSNGAINSDDLNTFLICIRITPDEPDPITVIDPTILSQILDALRISNPGCEVATNDSTMAILTTVALIGGLLAIIAPVVIGVVTAYIIKEKKVFANDYETYEGMMHNFPPPGYTSTPVYVPPTTMNVSKTYGTHFQKHEN